LSLILLNVSEFNPIGGSGSISGLWFGGSGSISGLWLGASGKREL